MLVSIIIPVYRGENSIENLTENLIRQLSSGFQLEIVLINDASPDQSEAACIRAYERNPGNVRFFSLAKNTGEHNAVMAGLTQCRGDIAVIMDDDFQNPISEVKKLIEYIAHNDFDVVYTHYPHKHHSYWRNLGSRFNDTVANWMLKKPHNLYLSSFKAINRFLIDEIIKYTLPFTYIDALVLRTTQNIGKIEVEHRPRRSGASGYTFYKLVKLWTNMFTSYSMWPLRVSFFIGALLSLLGFVIAAFTFVERFYNPRVPLGYTSLMVALTLFSGTMLIAIGLVGEYIGRMFMAQNKHPQYVIRKRFEKQQ